jgi:flagellar hook-length control protein FliK
MQISTPTPPARSVGPAPNAGHAPADASGGDFANLLQSAAPEAPAHADGPAEPAGASSREARTRSAARPPQARPAERPPAERPPADAAGAPGADDGDTDPDAAAIEAAPDRQLLDWIAGLHVPPATPHDDAAATALAGEPATSDAALDESPGRTGLPGLALRRPLGGGVDSDAGTAAGAAWRGADARDKAGLAAAGMRADAATAIATDPAAAAAKAEGFRAAIEAATGARAQPATETTPSAAAVAAQTAPAAAPGTDAAAAPVAVPLPTPLADPQFPRAFGVQVSVLARDGVQQAELHLNPAEMGPVAVQIVMDGTHARIEFGADAAGTRQLIESSLPDLAAALREAGLTLSGGGVSQHPSGREAGDGRTGPDRPGEADASDAERAAAAAPRRQVRAGGVDVYA